MTAPRTALSLAAVALICSGACSRNASPPVTAAEAPAPQRTVSPQTVIASDLPPLPPGINTAVRPPEVVRATYEFAARHPEVLNYVPCFCGCERGGHQDNHDCFVAARDSEGRVTRWDAHAMVCQVCLDVAYDSMQMHATGASVAAIRKAVEAKYAPHFQNITPTPLPGGRGGGHDRP